MRSARVRRSSGWLIRWPAGGRHLSRRERTQPRFQQGGRILFADGQRGDRQGRRRHRRCRGGGSSGSEERSGRQITEGGKDRRYGRRWRQLRSGTRRGRSRHNDGHRHGRRDGKCRHHAPERRSRWHRSRPPALASHHEQHPANLFFASSTTPPASRLPRASCIPDSAFWSRRSAAAAMALSSVSVVGNALRLRVTRL